MASAPMEQNCALRSTQPQGSKPVRIFIRRLTSLVGRKRHGKGHAQADRPYEAMPAKQKVIAFDLALFAHPFEPAAPAKPSDAKLQD